MVHGDYMVDGVGGFRVCRGLKACIAVRDLGRDIGASIINCQYHCIKNTPTPFIITYSGPYSRFGESVPGSTFADGSFWIPGLAKVQWFNLGPCHAYLQSSTGSGSSMLGYGFSYLD